MTLSVEDRLDILQLLNLYGHVIDERQFSRLGELFTTDAVFDLSDFDGTRFEGLEAIDRMMRDSEQHPLGHHATNIVICQGQSPVSSNNGSGLHGPDPDTPTGDAVVVLSKGIGVGNGGRVGSVTYRDRLVNTPDGWRIRERVCTLRRADAIPEPG